jgi:uncharacterized membrane protein
MSLVKSTVSDIKAELKPAKFIATFVVILLVLWIVVFLSRKFSWFKAVNPIANQ